MTTSDIIGTVGVILMLVPFILNIADVLSNDSPMYIIPNLIGSGLACVASLIINYLPFVILEGAWSLISCWALYIYFKRDFRKKHVDNQ